MQRREWKTARALWQKLGPRVRELRKLGTVAEIALWNQLRGRRLAGRRFRRQHSFGPYILDFYCAEARLAVEVDGPIHLGQKESDTVRDEFLEASGIHVARFSNDQVILSMDGVLAEIERRLRLPLSEIGEGDGG